MDVTPFTIDVPLPVLDDLRERLLRTRWPNEAGLGLPGTGPSQASMRALVDYWLNDFNWAAQQSRLNELTHLRVTFSGTTWHVVHERSAAPSATPIVLLHGWPDSFVRFRHLIPMLTHPGDDGRSFHVVVPSLPGFDFSDQPAAGQLRATRVADQVDRVMAGLGYDQYLVHGGDWGAVVAQEVARRHPERVRGLHLTDIPFPNLFRLDRGALSETERAFLDSAAAWTAGDGAYIAIHRARPTMLSYGLTDSPVGLAAWLRDHFDRLVTTPIPIDDLLTNVMLSWAGGTIRSSLRLYSESSLPDGDDAEASLPEVTVPAAFAIFPDDIWQPPRELAERFFDVTRFTRMPRGGHFAALEEPALLAQELRAFATDLQE